MITSDHLKRWDSFERTEGGVIFRSRTAEGQELDVALEFVFPDVLRVRMNPTGLGKGKTHLLTRDEREPVSFALEEGDQFLALKTERMRVEVSREPWEIRVRDLDGKVFFREASDDVNVTGRHEVLPLGFAYDACTGSYRTRETVELAPDESLYGFGEKFSRLDKVGQEVVSWTCDALGVSSHRSYKNIPFFLSSRGYGLFVNSTYKITYELGTRSLVSYSILVDDAELDYFLIYGPSFKHILRRYCDLTGYAPVPPKWSFGLWMSRASYQSRAELEEVCEKLRERDIPCDVVHLDPYWMGGPENWCNFEWDTERFHDPEGMIAWLKERGFKLCLWENPYVPRGTAMFEEGAREGYFVKGEDGSPYLIFEPDWWTETELAVVDFTNPAAVKWYQEKHRRLLSMGAAVFKTDFGESAPAEGRYYNGMSGAEVHNLYPLLYNRAVFEVVNEFSGGKGLVWARSAYAGSQRYPVHWGGDCLTTFAHMACQLRGGLSLGLSGIPFYSHDIGGFFPETNPTLYVRWAQFGLFSSHSRCHGVTPREPWEFGPDAEAIFRKYAKLRYRLLPYIYSCAVISARTGLPMMRALVLEYQDDPKVRGLDSEYLFGESFLVAPILDEGEERDVYLPRGRWIDYWTGQAYEGPVYISYHAPLDTLPLFVKDGAIIPMGPEMGYVGERPIAPLTLDIYPAEKGSFTVYDEDRPRVEVTYRREERMMTIEIREFDGRVEVVLHGLERPQEVWLNGPKLSEENWRYDGKLTIQFKAEGNSRLTIV